MIERIKEIAAEAGAEILRFYGGSDAVQSKSDNSPLTLADQASHQHIVQALAALEPAWPVLSEESSAEEIAARHSWERFWLVDPLDGTKEFIKQTGEFTVNIALIQRGVAVLGVIYVPVLGFFYWAEKGVGAWKQEVGLSAIGIQVRKADTAKLEVVASRDHAGPEVAALLERFPTARCLSMGSSLKFCLVAEGKADLYLRDVPTMEWDTAAAQCIVEAAGGAVTLLDGTPLTYNKNDLRNPALITQGDINFVWK